MSEIKIGQWVKYSTDYSSPREAKVVGLQSDVASREVEAILFDANMFDGFGGFFPVAISRVW